MSTVFHIFFGVFPCFLRISLPITGQKREIFSFRRDPFLKRENGGSSLRSVILHPILYGPRETGQDLSDCFFLKVGSLFCVFSG